ncbi:uncharacterized protein LOC117314937 [Pecten maximus]|uniref:uncharacterized protein LOC117314937 n=1 Tax=Pecten maximus TaxID=6579 RepID=UPI001458A539|nr:uncharacterized protein LOC117314937 [Pecten maximus]
MSHWSSYILVLLCPLIWTWRVDGEYLESLSGTDVNTDRNILGDQISTLIQKINQQEDRLQSLETKAAKHAHAMAEKDRRIDQLEQELAALKFKMAPVLTSFGKTTSEEVGKGQQAESVSNGTVKNQLVKDNTNPRIADYNIRNKDKPTGNQRVQVDDYRKHFDSFGRKLAFETESSDANYESAFRNAESLEYPGPVGVGKIQATKQQEKRVDNTPPSGVAFSVSLSASTDVVQQSTIKYNDVMIDVGNGYNHGNGIYVVPVSGVYAFTWSTTSAVNNGRAICTYLMINGVVTSGTCADSDASDWESATGVIVTSVSAGDHVYVLSRSIGQIISDGSAKSTFAGWLLF